MMAPLQTEPHPEHSSQSLSNLYGFASPSGIVGIEVEVEGLRLPDGAIRGWHVKQDGSLRNYHGIALEYVSAGPVAINRVPEHLDKLSEAFERMGSHVPPSPRTSVHVHLNASGFTLVQIMGWITTYAIVEDALLSYCGMSRRTNLFAIPLYQQHRIQRAILNMVPNRYNPDHSSPAGRLPRNDDVKYCAINVGALGRFGSLEFRSLYGTVDKQVIQRWVDILVRIREFGTSHTPDKVLRVLDRMGLDAFTTHLLGEPMPRTKFTKDSLMFAEQLASRFQRWSHP